MPFELPDINFQPVTPPLQRDKYTTRAMISNLRNKGYEDILQSVFPIQIDQMTDQQLIEWLTNNIQVLVAQYIQQPSDGLLYTIFHSIQIWGGNSARMFYFNNGAEQNFDLDAYRNALPALRNGDVVTAIGLFRENIHRMNIAFASKHFSFWTGDLQGLVNMGPKQLPILDRLIYRVVYGVNRQPDYRHYLRFVNEMYDEIQQMNGVTIQNLERQLFNFADTEAGIQWMNRNE